MYKKLTHVEHILKRPDSYVGSVVPEIEQHWILEGETFCQKPIIVSPGLLKIFDEILVNALDQATVHPRDVKKISAELGDTITIENNGPSIPIERHAETGVWVPELIFGHLLTSSNYDDDQERVVGGRNGYGAKLTNVFSKKFQLTIENAGEIYTQVWENNMSICHPPIIKEKKSAKGLVRISFQPDWERFGTTFEKMKPVLEKRILDAAAWTTAKVNNLPIKTFEDYVRMYTDLPLVKYKGESWEVYVAPSPSGFQQVSFVNGICTTKGGTHIEHLVTGIVTQVRNTLKDISPYQVKQSLWLFVKCSVINPTFSSQAKTELTSRNLKTVIFPPKFIKDLMNNGLKDSLESLLHAKAIRELKKNDGIKRVRLTGIPKLDDANWAGTGKSDACTLILTEGDSAKTLAVAGLSVVGRDRFGIFPLRGKPTNVRDASTAKIGANEELNNLKKILGLAHGVNYETTKSLRYGRVLIMTDADLDGSHIKGLILNMFHFFWPSLINLGYVCAMVTPVVKVGAQWFFTEDDYRSASGLRGLVKYYKGLGTSTSTEAKEYFRQIDRLTVAFTADEKMKKSMTLAFAKDHADHRKEWLRDHMESRPPAIQYGKVQKLSVTDFVRQDLANFSAADIHRSIPHVCDGLKPSQRKVIYACIKKNLGVDMKVAQLSGYVAEQTQYHHGEASLQGTIVNLAQNFMGANNINLLEPSGQFGTRLMGGKDSASARYIFTRLSPQTQRLFDSRDNPILKYVVEDGDQVEPEFYIPILPMVLVNGAEGIGTGFSCTIPPYNPDDVKANLLRMLDKIAPQPMKPWFKGFKGTVTQKNETTWVMEGVAKKEGESWRVTELPPGMWTQEFKEKLEKLDIKYENHSTETDVNFLVTGELPPLTKTIHTSNMYLIDPNGSVKKYESPEEILLEYIAVRIEHYKLRKKYHLTKLDLEIVWLSEKARFIRDVAVTKCLTIFNVPMSQIEDQLRRENYDEVIWSKLLDIKTYQYTKEEVEKLLNLCTQKKMERQVLKDTTVVQLYQNNLSEL
jgi:DNA topoisomerase-2